MKKLVMKIVKGIEYLSALTLGFSAALMCSVGFDWGWMIVLILSLIILFCTFIKIESETKDLIDEENK